jgi:signal transduction histidine kinase
VPFYSLARQTARRPYAVSSFAVVAIAATFGAMYGLNATSKLGTIAFAPWVGLIGFDAGGLAGISAAVAALALWAVATAHMGPHATALQLVVRFFYLGLLGVGTAASGRRLRTSERAHGSTAALQSALLDSTLDGICLTDAAGTILIANAPMRRLGVELDMPTFGTVPERLIAVSPRIVDSERYRTRMLELAETTGEMTTDEFEIADSGRVFRGFTAPVRDQRGRLAGRIWTLREVTADREIDRMRDAFVATVSHELRTPLTSISGFLEMMHDEEAALGDTGRSYLDVIRRSTERLHNLVEDLLLVAQIEARRVELDMELVDLQSVAHGCVEAMRPAADEKGVSIAVVADHPPMILADRNRIAQVVDNLISNAIKFTESSGSVTVSVGGNDGWATIVVADTGIGVPADEQQQVFSRFFRASTATTRAIPGTGLGLSISRALVEQHDGAIAIESEEEHGTKITVMLPAQQA